MDDAIALSVRNVGKMYTLYDRPQDRLKQAFLWGRKQLYREFWALRDVSFEAKRGKAIGITDCNGFVASGLAMSILEQGQRFWITEADLHSHLRARMHQRGTRFNARSCSRLRLPKRPSLRSVDAFCIRCVPCVMLRGEDRDGLSSVVDSGRRLARLEPILQTERPDCVLVQERYDCNHQEVRKWSVFVRWLARKDYRFRC